jgi:hypothetical protein
MLCSECRKPGHNALKCPVLMEIRRKAALFDYGKEFLAAERESITRDKERLDLEKACIERDKERLDKEREILRDRELWVRRVYDGYAQMKTLDRQLVTMAALLDRPSGIIPANRPIVELEQTARLEKRNAICDELSEVCEILSKGGVTFEFLES